MQNKSKQSVFSLQYGWTGAERCAREVSKKSYGILICANRRTVDQVGLHFEVCVCVCVCSLSDNMKVVSRCLQSH